jgi:hypothetical protein
MDVTKDGSVIRDLYENCKNWSNVKLQKPK